MQNSCTSQSEGKPCIVGPKSYFRNVALRGANMSQY